MSRQIQIRRGTKNQHASFTGAIGEVTMDTTNNTLRVHDGVTVGGNEMLSRNGFFSYVTNCITEISQDIRLELNKGTLVLKSGSKIYIPNGTNKFEEYTIKQDQGLTPTTNGTYLVGYAFNFANVTTYISATSGDTEPTSVSNGFAWYDTKNNVIKRSWAGTWQSSLFSLPLAVITVSNGVCVSIDYVFNGFGYIGSTIFTLPGVKGLIPNGRNDDGTLKNIIMNNTSVKTVTKSGTYSGTIAISSDGSIDGYGSLNYNSDENINYSVGVKQSILNAGSVTFGLGGEVTSFSPKKVFSFTSV